MFEVKLKVQIGICILGFMMVPYTTESCAFILGVMLVQMIVSMNVQMTICVQSEHRDTKRQQRLANT